MRSSLAKVLHPLCGRPLIDYSIEALRQAGSKQVFLVVSAGKTNPLAGHARQFPGVHIAVQNKPLGTGHAAACGASALKNFEGYIFIHYGDCPLIRPETIKALLKTVIKEKADLGFVTAILPHSRNYGRVVRDADGDAVRIVEEKEATVEEKTIREVNMGFYCIRARELRSFVKKLSPHADTKEYYLTDIVEMAAEKGLKVISFRHEDPVEFLGINTQSQLAEAAAIMRNRVTEEWMSKGICFLDPRSTYVESQVTIGADTVIHPQVCLHGKTRIGKNCIIENGSVLKNMVVGDGVHIKSYSILEESVIEKGAQIGPFARIRPLSHVGAGARVGNFVELKKTKLGPGVKANHLSYLGDAIIGADTNIGCGTITCNYDGVKKHPTNIGKKVFVGSDVQFVAPVRVGDGAYIGAGSTITDNVPPKSLAIARGRQVIKKKWAKRRKS